MSDSKSELTNYRLQRAYEALEDARILAGTSRWISKAEAFVKHIETIINSGC